MTAMPIWAWPILVAIDLWQKWVPRRYAIPGKTRVRYNFSGDANRSVGEQYTTHKRPEEGLVVGYQYEYVGPWNNNRRSIGTYADHKKFPQGLIVKPDSGGALRCVPLENAKLISGYGHTIPGFGYKRHRDSFRLGPLPKPLQFYPRDTVFLVSDITKTPRKIGRIFFTPLGEPEYEVLMTDDEIRRENDRRKEEARLENENRAPDDDWERGHVICEGGTYSWARDGDLVLVSRAKVASLGGAYKGL